MPLALRTNVLQMTPYSPGKPVEEVKRELGLDRVVKLASNENPFGPSPKAIAAVADAARQMHIYPDAAAHDLKAKIAQKYQISPHEVLLGNGSDELIHLLGVMFLNEEDEVIVAKPSFARHDAAAHLSAGKLVGVPVDADFRHDLDAMADAVTDRTRLIFVANPHNPTGTIVRRDAFERFLDRIPAHVAVVLDEAYHEFAADVPDLPNSLDYVRAGRNVIGLRTFSKAYGLAGIRVGFGFATPEVVDAYHRAREPFNVNCLAQAAAIAALEDDAHLELTVRNNSDGLEALRRSFEAVGAKVVDSHANFGYADMGRPATEIFQQLLRRGVIVRAGAHVGHPNCLRVSVGTPEEMEIFDRELRIVCAESVPA